ncbi:glycosyltransferase [Candidatus Micrarchaeota archaeon]|nr:glycosyltransferase [Candidatus Micrarchaeota archaeon]
MQTKVEAITTEQQRHNKMKIVFFTDTYHPQTNGVVVYIHDAIAELSKEHDIILIAPDKVKKIEEERTEHGLRIKIPSWPFPFYKGYLVAKIFESQIAKIIEREQPDIIHLHAPIWLGLKGLEIAQHKKIPVVITYHTHFPDYVPHILGGHFPERLKGATDYLTKKMIKSFFSKADVVITPSEELKKELEKYGLKNIEYVQNGIDLTRFDGASKETIEKFKRQYKLADKHVVLYTGRLSIEKGVDRLVEIAGLLDSKNTVVLIVGTGPRFENLKKKTDKQRIKNIIFTGFVNNEELIAAYQSADVFVSPSTSETFGLTFVEAMYNGLPVIGMNKLGPKEIIKDGQNGYLIQTNQTREIVERVNRLISEKELRTQMSNHAREDAQKYGIARNIAKILEIYQKTIKKHKK